jgi:hypothetical protein
MCAPSLSVSVTLAFYCLIAVKWLRSQASAFSILLFTVIPEKIESSESKSESTSHMSHHL